MKGDDRSDDDGGERGVWCDEKRSGKSVKA